MPRLARAVFAGVPHHITQRGNRRGDVFFSDADRLVYLEWLEDYCARYEVDVLAYCLMTNHVHLVVVPNTNEGLQSVFKPLHMRYAQRINREHGWKGHLWQGRFFSAPLDEAYLWTAIRYVERNPVRAQIVTKAEDYPWSSAAAHCGVGVAPVLTDKAVWIKQIEAMGDWSSWLSVGEQEDQLKVLRLHVEKGLPCGSEDFVHKLGEMIGRRLDIRHQGRPRRDESGRKG